MNKIEVAIVGSGPYGLSIAANLASRGVETALFGKPMAFWDTIARAAPERYLKSYCFGADIPVPEPIGFSDWSSARGLETFEPCAMRDFVDYGLELQRRFAPFAQESNIADIRKIGHTFLLHPETGEDVLARHVIVATGLSRFELIPRELVSLPAEFLLHSNAVKDYRRYRGKHVAVIGGGQSALEAAALVHEAGGDAELVIRDRQIRWMSRLIRERSLLKKLRSPISRLGSGPKAWVLTNLPGACRLVPDGPRINFLRRHLPPEGAWWLRSRVEGKVSTLLGTTVSGASIAGKQVTLSLSGDVGSGRERRYDAIIAATGFRPAVERLSFLAPDLRDQVQCVDHSPRLDRYFQSSVPGLYFVGPAAAASFGPLFRFVVGAHHATATLTRRLADGKRYAA